MTAPPFRVVSRIAISLALLALQAAGARADRLGTHALLTTLYAQYQDSNCLDNPGSYNGAATISGADTTALLLYPGPIGSCSSQITEKMLETGLSWEFSAALDPADPCADQWEDPEEMDVNGRGTLILTTATPFMLHYAWTHTGNSSQFDGGRFGLTVQDAAFHLVAVLVSDPGTGAANSGSGDYTLPPGTWRIEANTSATAYLYSPGWLPSNTAAFTVSLTGWPPDADGDGLANTWEDAGGGYDADGDGVPDIRLSLLGANPLHKDLFLEIDETAGHTVSRAAMDSVAAHFANAPAQSPDGIGGIAFHPIFDESGIATGSVWHVTGCWPAEFDPLAALHRGPIPHTPALKAAWDKVTYYGIVGPPTNGDRWGCGEVGGRNLSITLSGAGSSDVRTQAALIMHEFGHNLGLDHGGVDDVNGKPNYVSIMNYTFTWPGTPPNANEWRLDYSREALAALDENHLNEPTGIGASTLTPISMMISAFDPSFGSNASRKVVEAVFGSPVDFDFDHSATGTNVAADLNYYGPDYVMPEFQTPSPGQVMNGSDDWGRIIASLPSTYTAPRRASPVYAADYLGQTEYNAMLSLAGSLHGTAVSPGSTESRRTALRVLVSRDRAAIDFVLASPSSVRLEIFDPAGRLVRILDNRIYGAGGAELSWDLRDVGGTRVPRGVYLLRMTTPEERLERKLTVAR